MLTQSPYVRDAFQAMPLRTGHLQALQDPLGVDVLADQALGGVDLVLVADLDLMVEALEGTGIELRDPGWYPSR